MTGVGSTAAEKALCVLLRYWPTVLVLAGDWTTTTSSALRLAPRRSDWTPPATAPRRSSAGGPLPPQPMAHACPDILPIIVPPAGSLSRNRGTQDGAD